MIGVLLHACRTVARELSPFLPEAAARIDKVLVERDTRRGRAVFTKVEGPVRG